MKIIMKINSLIIIALLLSSNIYAQNWDCTIKDLGGDCSKTFTMHIEELPLNQYVVDTRTHQCVLVTLENEDPADLFLKSTNGYDVVFPQTEIGMAVICFGPDSGYPLTLPLTAPEKIIGGVINNQGGIHYKNPPPFGGSCENICTVMIGP